jgi:hypothetical protein
MASVNKVVAARKLRVTVTIEEFGPSKPNESPKSGEFWTRVRNFLEDQIVNQSFQTIRWLFWWILERLALKQN